MADAARFFNWRGLQSVGKGNIIEMLLFVDYASLGGINAHASLNFNLAGTRVPLGRVRSWFDLLQYR